MRTLFLTLSQDCRLAKIWLSMACTHSSRSSYVDASKFHVWPVSDTMMNSKESSCSAGAETSTDNMVLVDAVQRAMLNLNNIFGKAIVRETISLFYQLQFAIPVVLSCPVCAD